MEFKIVGYLLLVSLISGFAGYVLAHQTGKEGKTKWLLVTASFLFMLVICLGLIRILG